MVYLYIYGAITLVVALGIYSYLLYLRALDPVRYTNLTSGVLVNDWFMCMVIGLGWPIFTVFAFIEFCIKRHPD